MGKKKKKHVEEDSDSDESGKGDKSTGFCPYFEYLSEGKELFRQKSYSMALKYYELACAMEPENIKGLVARSKCFLQLGRNDEALKDAETALRFEPNNVNAIYQKAEAYYLMGIFEFALVFYERGQRLRPDMDKFRLGAQKAQAAIRSSVGPFTRIKLHKWQVEKLRQKQANKAKNRLFQQAGPNVRGTYDVVATQSLLQNVPRELIQKEEDKVLEEVAIDKLFCKKLAANKELFRINKPGGKVVKETALNLVSFMEVRQEFWRQQKPVNPVLSKKDMVAQLHLRMRKKGGIYANLKSILKQAEIQLHRIQQGQDYGRWRDVISMSRRLLALLLPVKFFMWPQKANVICSAYCSMGVACRNLGMLERALLCHLKELEIAIKRYLTGAKDVALEHLGKTYVKMDMHDRAIEVWKDWLPRCKKAPLRSWLLHAIGRSHLHLGEVDPAKDCGLKARAAAISARDMNLLLNATVLVAHTEVLLDNFESALSLMREAVTIARRLHLGQFIEILELMQDKVRSLVYEANLSSEAIETHIFHIDIDEKSSIFAKEMVEALLDRKITPAIEKALSGVTLAAAEEEEEEIEDFEEPEEVMPLHVPVPLEDLIVEEVPPEPPAEEVTIDMADFEDEGDEGGEGDIEW